MDRAEQPLQGDAVERRGYVVEEALELIYRGQCNVAVKAKELGGSTEARHRRFRIYAIQRPIVEDGWGGDVELGWPCA